MEPQTASTQSLDMQQLLKLHNLTKDVAKVFQKQLRNYLDTMQPLFRPRRFLGDHMDGAGREPVVGSDRTVSELREMYGRVAGKPFNLLPDLKFPLESVSAQTQLHEWEYVHTAQTERGLRPIQVTAPLTWVLSYTSPLSFSTLRHVLSGRQERDQDALRVYALRALLMQQLFAKFPGIQDLFQGLRFRIDVRRSPQMGELPVVTISAPFSTFRPPDHLVAIASGLAGGDNFAEVLDLNSVRESRDVLRDTIGEILSAHGQEM